PLAKAAGARIALLQGSAATVRGTPPGSTMWAGPGRQGASRISPQPVDGRCANGLGAPRYQPHAIYSGHLGIAISKGRETPAAIRNWRGIRMRPGRHRPRGAFTILAPPRRDSAGNSGTARGRAARARSR